MKKNIDASVYESKDIKFETNGILRKVLNFFLIPFLNHLPAKTIRALVKTHKSADVVVKNKTNHYALEILYQKGKTFKSKNIIHTFFRKVWFHTNNARAVRNRLKIVKAELERDINTRIKSGDSYIKILNIASGSARAVLEAISSFSAHKSVIFDVTFLDKNPAAVEYSKALAKEVGVDTPKLQWVTATVGEYFAEHDKNKSEPFDIVEMVGLMDYFEDDKAISVFSRIYSRLNTGAFFITANIVDNIERPFVTDVMGWKMIYRYAAEFKSLLIKAGFEESKVCMYYDPLYTHTLASSYK